MTTAQHESASSKPHVPSVGRMADETVYDATETILLFGNFQPEINRVMLEFADKHPTFAERFEIQDQQDSDDPNVLTSGLHTGLPTEEEVRNAGKGYSIDSEWDFAVAFGYSIAIHDMINSIRTENSGEPLSFEDGGDDED